LKKKKQPIASGALVVDTKTRIAGIPVSVPMHEIEAGQQTSRRYSASVTIPTRSAPSSRPATTHIPMIRPTSAVPRPQARTNIVGV
jgi:hypothetical protein